jgi:DNA invertase Pin-like site-specific DNA recombinase/uncharacterized small protein (DUF1192 family)
MNIAAYCRVSTDREDQLNSLEAQKRFFTEYTKKTGDTLVQLYADEGISGTKTKNRREFLRLMRDAESGLFDIVVVKDISRFARNTVDLLQNIRRLKTLGIETMFLTANMTSIGNSEFVLTIFGALAQEESANTSKRVKFGKRLNAEKGRVPNLVYGYNKTPGDYFNITINEEEAANIRRIYDWYVKDGCGTAKIANRLNEEGLKTKRNCAFTQNAICRILTNELYTGAIINGKEEVTDFLTSTRANRDKSEWMVTHRPDLRIIPPELQERAKTLLEERGQAFRTRGQRQSNQHLFSTLIRCRECGWSFRRTVRTYQNTYVRWVCSGHNGKGADTCPNKSTLDETVLVNALQGYFTELLQSKKNIIRHVRDELHRLYRSNNGNEALETELRQRLSKLEKKRRKYMDMYTDDLMTREELNTRIGGMREEMTRLKHELELISLNNRGEELEKLIEKTFSTTQDITDIQRMTNTQLRQMIRTIEVDMEGNVEIFLQPLGNLDATPF